MITALIDACVRRPAIAIVVSAAVCAAGVWALASLPIDAIPDLSDTQVIVVVDWEGQNAQVVQDQVTQPLSAALLGIARVRDVRAQSTFGAAFVHVIFADGTDIHWARTRVMERLQGLALPPGASLRLGPEATGLGWIYMYTIEDATRDTDLGEVRAIHDGFVATVLRGVNGVAEIAVVGGAQRRYEVIVDPERLLAMRVTVPEIAAAIARANGDTGGMSVEIAEREHMVRGRAYLASVRDIENVVVRGAGDDVITVHDLAEVVIAPAPERGIADRNGRGEVVAGIVVMRQGANPRDVIARVKDAIDRTVRPGLPKGVVLREAYDRTPLIRRATATLTTATLQALAMVLVVCFVFLLHARSALVAFVTLPAGALVTFLAMKALGLQANIMSIAGIAIAFGTMVDASICMVENAHRHLARGSTVAAACREVGPGLFASLAVCTIANLPLFALEDQAGRLFVPLAWTNTLAMAAACLLSVTLVPPLIVLFVRGRIVPEEQNPVSRGMVAVYGPVVGWSLRARWLVIGAALVASVAVIVPWGRLGSEFMPPLEEGDVLYMPTSAPGLAPAEARRALQTQDRILASFPEVKNVLGKAGRSSSATDPAPMEMIETTVMLHDEATWPARRAADPSIPESVNEYIRRRLAAGLARERDSMKTGVIARPEDDARFEEIRFSLQAKLLRAMEKDIEALAGRRVRLRRVTFDELVNVEMERAITQPGMPNWFLMPIQTRIGMTTTGMRGVLGLKVYGPDYARVERIATSIERVLPGAVAERLASGGTYLDVNIDRAACARLGVPAADVQAVVETALGGMAATRMVEGPHRFAVAVRYPRERRDTPDAIRRVLVRRGSAMSDAGPLGDVVLLGQLTTVDTRPGPMAIRSENNMLVAHVPVSFEGVSLGEYVARAREAIAKIEVPPGYAIKWSGEYEIMERTNRRLLLVGIATIAAIALVLFVHFRRAAPALIILASLLFAPVGAVALTWALGYEVSAAWWLGLLLLLGLAAETGVIMLVYIDNAYDALAREHGRMTKALLDRAIVEGATMRVRPKVMTAAVNIFGLAPLLWAAGAGAATLQRMAAPMLGGMVTSLLLTLVVLPAVYRAVRGRGLPDV